MSTTAIAANPRVRRATFDDLDRLEEFYARAYPGRERWKFPERWRWEYVDNPFGSSDSLPLLLAEDDGRIIGQSGSMCVKCRVGGETVNAAWSVDTIVLPGYRGHGLGRKLQQANQEANDLFLSLSMTPINRIIKKKLGGMQFRSMSMFARVNAVDHRVLNTFVEQLTSRRTKENVGKVAGNTFRLSRFNRLAAWSLARYYGRSASKLKKVEAGCSSTFEPATLPFDGKADALWERVRERFDFAVERDSTYLNWKYCSQPWTDYRAAFALRGSKVVGLVVYRMGHPIELPVGVIADVIVDDDTGGVYGEIVAFATRELERQGAQTVIVGCADVEHSSLLEDAGFIKYWEHAPMAGGNPDLVAKVAAADRVLLSLGDHDLDHPPFVQMRSPLKLLNRFDGETEG